MITPWMSYLFFFNDTATTEIYTYCHTLSLHDALPIFLHTGIVVSGDRVAVLSLRFGGQDYFPQPMEEMLPVAAERLVAGDSEGEARESEAPTRSEEHTSELQSLMRISYAVFCLKHKTHTINTQIAYLTHTQHST